MDIRIVYCETRTTTRTKAASFAALIRDTLGTPVELESGHLGQFDIVVAGRRVVSRKGGLLAKLLGRPWPSNEEVLTVVRAGMREVK